MSIFIYLKTAEICESRKAYQKFSSQNNFGKWLKFVKMTDDKKSSTRQFFFPMSL